MILSLEQLFKMEMDQLAKERELSDPDPVIWRWSPLEIDEFDRMLQVAHNLAVQQNNLDGTPFHGLSFAEAGCGIGTKLYLAKHKYELIEYGYEINDEYLLKCHELEVCAEKRDLADLDNAPAWAAYDIVYIARPFKNDMFERKWEQSVQDAMRPGAVLISAFTANKPYSWACYYKAPFRGVWVKPIQDDGSTRPLAAAASVAVP